MATAAQRSSAGRYASNISWARTPNRAERTAKARANSPVTYGYWLKKITDEGVVRAEDIPAAAENAHRAYMQSLSRKAHAKRAENDAA